MEILDVLSRADVLESKALSAGFVQFSKLIAVLKERTLPVETVELINGHVNEINATNAQGKALLKEIRKSQTAILMHLDKTLKIVPTGQYVALGFVLGMSLIGIPLGLIISTTLKNPGLLGLGLPVGMFIGAIIGKSKEKKAKEEGRLLDIKIK